MDKQDQLEELLVDWRLQRQQGNELSAEELCKDSPEFVPELSKMISQLKEMDWLEADDDSDDDFLHLPDFSTVTNRADDTRLPASGITLDQFCQRLIESGLMDADDVAKYRKLYPATDAVSFAQQLVKGKKLTRFQATVLLEGRDLPLVLDRYVILDEIGAGGMGAVFKALHQQMDRIVALKILPKSVVDSSEKIKRFQREVKAAAKLEHQNIVVAHDATEFKGTHFLVMSYVDGQDLAKLVRQSGPLSVTKAVHYIAQAARGLKHAHGMGIIHRDIKPANLLLDRKGTVKILDMGLARMESTEPETEHTVSQELTQAGMVMGTIAYLAPEQALDTRNADARSDMYSLGCTLYFLLTGKVPYNEDTMMKTIMAHREGAIPSLCDERNSVPAELDAIFQKMVAKKPENRFQSMAEVVSALETLDIRDDEGQQPVVAGSEAMENTATYIDTSREFVEPTLIVAGRKKPPLRFWPIVAVCLFGIIGIAWAASILLKVETAAGTIILEIDQPELAGAEVLVDGQKRIRIKTGEGTKPIQVEADEKTHTLKVTKRGFEAFVTTFTVKAGKEQTITVRLEPMNERVTEATTVVQPEPTIYIWPQDQPAPAIAPFTPEEAQQHQKAWAKHLGVPVEMENSIGMKFRLIPPGEFMMGSSEEEISKLLKEGRERKHQNWYVEGIPNEGPKHKVTLSKPFGLAIHEVTRGHFRLFVEATGYKTDAETDGKGGYRSKDGRWIQVPEILWNTNLGFDEEQTDDHPVVNVSWNDAVAFCEWLSKTEGVAYHLPTEAEWEFACRAGNQGRYSFGDEESKLTDFAWYAVQGGRNTKPVGQKAANSFGLFDLHGNVWEWCNHGLEPYTAAHTIDPVGTKGANSCLLRGGAFFNPPNYARSAVRSTNPPFYRDAGVGFRVSRTFEKHEPKEEQERQPLPNDN